MLGFVGVWLLPTSIMMHVHDFFQCAIRLCTLSRVPNTACDGIWYQICSWQVQASCVIMHT